MKQWTVHFGQALSNPRFVCGTLRWLLSVPLQLLGHVTTTLDLIWGIAKNKTKQKQRTHHPTTAKIKSVTTTTKKTTKSVIIQTYLSKWIEILSISKINKKKAAPILHIRECSWEVVAAALEIKEQNRTRNQQRDMWKRSFLFPFLTTQESWNLCVTVSYDKELRG